MRRRHSGIRYERARPGELIHVDVKKLGRLGRRGPKIGQHAKTDRPVVTAANHHRGAQYTGEPDGSYRVLVPMDRPAAGHTPARGRWPPRRGRIPERTVDGPLAQERRVGSASGAQCQVGSPFCERVLRSHPGVIRQPR